MKTAHDFTGFQLIVVLMIVVPFIFLPAMLFSYYMHSTLLVLCLFFASWPISGMFTAAMLGYYVRKAADINRRNHVETPCIFFPRILDQLTNGPIFEWIAIFSWMFLCSIGGYFISVFNLVVCHWMKQHIRTLMVTEVQNEVWDMRQNNR
jgi:hypothetical protein